MAPPAVRTHRPQKVSFKIKISSFRQIELFLPRQYVGKREVLWLIGVLPRRSDRYGQQGPEDKNRQNQR